MHYWSDLGSELHSLFIIHRDLKTYNGVCWSLMETRSVSWIFLHGVTLYLFFFLFWVFIQPFLYDFVTTSVQFQEQRLHTGNCQRTQWKRTERVFYCSVRLVSVTPRQWRDYFVLHTEHPDLDEMRSQHESTHTPKVERGGKRKVSLVSHHDQIKSYEKTRHKSYTRVIRIITMKETESES